MTANPFIVNMAVPRLIGMFLNPIFYGCLVIQTYLYYIAFPKDRTGIKILVYTVFFLETIQSGLVMIDLLYYFGFAFGDMQAFLRVSLSWFSVPILGSVVSSIVQFFFAWRIHSLSKSVAVASVVVLLSLLQLSSGIAQGILSFRVNDFSKLPITTAGIWLISAAVCDVVIAISMTWALKKKRTGTPVTDKMIVKVIRLTIETGSATAILAIITAGLRLAMIRNLNNYFVLPSSVLGKLYANNLVMIFNSRIRIVGGKQGSSSKAEEATLTRTANIPTNEVIMTEFVDLGHRASELFEVQVLPPLIKSESTIKSDKADITTKGLSSRWI